MKRDRTVIGHGALSLMVVALTLALGSCMQEPIGLSMPAGEGMMVRVTFPGSVATRATTTGTEVGTADENRLERVTILVFNEDGTKLETVLSEDVTTGNPSLDTSQPQWATEQTLMVSPIENPSSPKKIYAVANWGTTTFNKDTYTETMLQDELTTITTLADINDAKAYPMLMSGSKAVPSLSSAFYSVTVDMARQVSKIKTQFTISTAVQNYLPEIEWQVDQMTITVVNVPDKSYVVGRGVAPSGSTLLNSAPIAVDDIKPAASDQTVPATKELKWSESVYIHENPVTSTTPADKDVSTRIVVQLPYKNRKTSVVDMDNYYQLYIDDTSKPTSPHQVLRNTIYAFDIRILGMGLPFDKLYPNANIDDQLTVNSWEKGEIVDVEAPNNFFNIDRTYIGFQPFETSFQSTISTDVPDWKLVKADGTTLFSFAEGKTAETVIDGLTYKLSGTASAATVTVDRAVDQTSFSINKMTFMAKNLKVPFTVAYDNGFIPNSVLINAWWSYNLPPNGLQIAKRGDKVLPSGVAGSDDPTRQWKTSQTSTLYTTEGGLGMGVDNTAAMAGAEHPAAQYCRDMGEGWFLPSPKELELIFLNKSILGASYQFDTSSYYWSAMEYNSVASWGVGFNYGGKTTVSKTNWLRMRCVRAI